MSNEGAQQGVRVPDAYTKSVTAPQTENDQSEPEVLKYHLEKRQKYKLLRHSNVCETLYSETYKTPIKELKGT